MYCVNLSVKYIFEPQPKIPLLKALTVPISQDATAFMCDCVGKQFTAPFRNPFSRHTLVCAFVG